MVIFNSYVKLPEGIIPFTTRMVTCWKILLDLHLSVEWYHCKLKNPSHWSLPLPQSKVIKKQAADQSKCKRMHFAPCCNRILGPSQHIPPAQVQNLAKSQTGHNPVRNASIHVHTFVHTFVPSRGLFSLISMLGLDASNTYQIHHDAPKTMVLYHTVSMSCSQFQASNISNAQFGPPHRGFDPVALGVVAGNVAVILVVLAIDWALHWLVGPRCNTFCIGLINTYGFYMAMGYGSKPWYPLVN